MVRRCGRRSPPDRRAVEGHGAPRPVARLEDGLDALAAVAPAVTSPSRRPTRPVSGSRAARPAQADGLARGRGGCRRGRCGGRAREAGPAGRRVWARRCSMSTGTQNSPAVGTENSAPPGFTPRPRRGGRGLAHVPSPRAVRQARQRPGAEAADRQTEALVQLRAKVLGPQRDVVRPVSQRRDGDRHDIAFHVEVDDSCRQRKCLEPYRLCSR